MTRTPAMLLAVSLFGFSACDRALIDLPQDKADLRFAASGIATQERLANIGEKIFNDQNLSLNRNQSCATCEHAAWGFTAPDVAINAAGAVMPGSVTTRFAIRKPPSAAYATQSPPLHFDTEEELWIGGVFWDGHATGARLGSATADQALMPFIGAAEQALPDLACVVFRVKESKYSGLYTAAFGRKINDIRFPTNTDALCANEGNTVPLSTGDRDLAVAEYDNIGRAISAFEGSSKVNQFSSKYDAYLAGKAKLSALELEGLALYEGKANCAACHPSQGAKALFTDFTYDNIGIPANPQNPALIATGFVDLGLGGFLNDPAQHGKQKVPTLRNMDKRGIPGGAKSFMHNGALRTIEEVVHFYNTRDVLPACEVTANPQKGVNCWPQPEVATNVNHDELGDLGMTAAEEAAVVAYLKTLNDGYR